MPPMKTNRHNHTSPSSLTSVPPSATKPDIMDSVDRHDDAYLRVSGRAAVLRHLFELQESILFHRSNTNGECLVTDMAAQEELALGLKTVTDDIAADALVM